MKITLKQGLTLIASRPSLGKTSLALSIINDNKDKKVLYLDYESGKEYLEKKINNHESTLILDSASNIVEDIINIIKENKVDIVIIDYLQLLNSTTITSSNRFIVEPYIVKTLSNLSQTLNISIVLISNLPRENKIPDIDSIENMKIDLKDINELIFIFEEDNEKYLRILSK